MASVNRVILIGNLGADPEIRYTANQTAVTTLSLATTDHRMDKEGNKQSFTEWHRVVVWGRQAENAAKYLAKGRSCYIEGRLQTRSWDDKNGQKRYTTEIVAQTVQFLGGGRSEGASDYQQQNQQQYDNSQQQQFSAPEPSASIGSAMTSPDAPGLDEIPF